MLKSVDTSKSNLLKEIGSGAFWSCQLKNFNFPASLTKILTNSFHSNGLNLTLFISRNYTLIEFSCFANDYINYDIDQIQDYYNLYNGCVYSSDYKHIYAVSTNLTEIIFHPSVTKIGSSTFSTSMITNIKLPDTVTYIYSWGIHKAKKLKFLELSPNIKILAIASIYELPELKELIIPEGIQVIQRDAFYSLPKLSHIKLPSTAAIEERAFLDLRSIKTAFLVNESKINEYIFGGIPRRAFMPEPSCVVQSIYIHSSNIYVIIILFL